MCILFLNKLKREVGRFFEEGLREKDCCHVHHALFDSYFYGTLAENF